MKINTTVDQLYESITNALNSKTPFSFLRCGDGDTIILQPEKKEWAERYARVSRRNIGYVLEKNDGIQVKKNLERAICTADILGIAEIKHIKKNIYWGSQHEILENVLLENRTNISDRRYCTLDAHLHLLEKSYLDKILQSTRRIVIITARDVQKSIQKKFTNIDQIEFHKIPAEVHFEDTFKLSDFYPDIHRSIVQKIKSEDRNGQLCLFGAGFIGKNFGSEFKKMGGVAMDIGSVFDLWDGKQTRGPNRDKNAIKTEFLLNK